MMTEILLDREKILERMDVAFEHYHFSTEKITEILGYKNAGTYYNARSKKTIVSSENFVRIAHHLPDVNMDWLLTGKEEMIKSEMTFNYAAEPEMVYGNDRSIQSAAIRIEEKMEEMYQMLREINSKLN
jgi:hypothetical protein